MKKLAAGAVIVLLLCFLFGSCSNSSDEYRKTLESGQQKYYSGDSMTKEEYNAVKNFNEWKSNQTPKTYNEWDK